LSFYDTPLRWDLQWGFAPRQSVSAKKKRLKKNALLHIKYAFSAAVSIAACSAFRLKTAF